MEKTTISPISKSIKLNAVLFSTSLVSAGVPSFFVFWKSCSKLPLCDFANSSDPFSLSQLSIATSALIKKSPYSYQPFFLSFLESVNWNIPS